LIYRCGQLSTSFFDLSLWTIVHIFFDLSLWTKDVDNCPQLFSIWTYRCGQLSTPFLTYWCGQVATLTLQLSSEAQGCVTT
jgi:hypothetical protein